MYLVAAFLLALIFHQLRPKLVITKMPASSNLPSTSVDDKKRRKLIPKPLSSSKLPKTRKEARVASKSARLYETVDLLTQQNPNINIHSDVTFRPDAPNPDDVTLGSVASGVQFENDVAMVAAENSYFYLPSTQNVIGTVFADSHTDEAIEAIMATLETSERAMSPDIFAEDEHAYESETIGFIDEKISLIHTKIKILEEDGEKLITEEITLQKRLNEIKLTLKANKEKFLKLEGNLEKFSAFRNVL